MERRKSRILGKKINEENYEIYKLEFKNFIKSKKEDNLKKLKLMNLSEQEIEDNIWFYFLNSEKLIKVNDIINNIKGTNFNNLSPQEVLEKIIPENEYKKIMIQIKIQTITKKKKRKLMNKLKLIQNMLYHLNGKIYFILKFQKKL